MDMRAAHGLPFANRVQAGRNHGWPVITYGRNYVSGTKIGEGTERDDVVAPLAHWVPTSIAPSGMAFLTSERYPGWKGSLFIGGLSSKKLVRLTLKGDTVVGEEWRVTWIEARCRDPVVVACDKGKATECAHVAEAQLAAIVEQQCCPNIWIERHAGGEDEELTRHA